VHDDARPIRPDGEAAAAVLAAAIGAAWLGLIIPVSEFLPGLKAALNWYNPVGPLSGKTTTMVVVYLIAWAALHAMWRGRDVGFGRVWTWALVLLGVGLLGSFPPFYEMFTR
jgi:hypothetical protein